MNDRPIAFSEPGSFELYCHQSPPTVYPEESHSTVQVCIPFEGARYNVTRQSEQGTKYYHRLMARDVLVVPIGQQHVVDWTKDAGILSIQLSESFITKALDVPKLDLSDSMILRDPLLRVLANEIRGELLAPDQSSPALLEAFTTIVAYRIGKHALNGSSLKGKQRESALSSVQMGRIRAYIAEHMDKSITINNLADVVGLSMWHFLRRFTATEGVSPHVFLTRMRLQRARTLLAESELSIVEIALDVGMSHSHFSRTFLSHFGHSPTEFRRESRA